MASNSIAFPDWKSLKRLIWINDLYLKFSITEPPYSLTVCLLFWVCFLFFFSQFCVVLQGSTSSLQCSIINICHHLRKKKNSPCSFAVSRSNKRVRNGLEQALSHWQEQQINMLHIYGEEVIQPWQERISFCNTSLSMVYAFPY